MNENIIIVLCALFTGFFVGVAIASFGYYVRWKKARKDLKAMTDQYYSIYEQYLGQRNSKERDGTGVNIRWGQSSNESAPINVY